MSLRIFCILQNLVQIDLPSPLAVVCHDAGATNLIINWLTRYAGTINACMEGPAERLWLAAFPDNKPVSLAKALYGANAMLSGTGWASDVEHEARRRAKSFGITTVAAIDHWVNYSDRFIRQECLVLPDQIWVADREAEIEARRCFPNVQIQKLPNLYLENLVLEVERYNPMPAQRDPKRILYVLEPIREQWKASEQPGEYQALTYFLDNLAALGVTSQAQIQLRPHPSDPPGKYNDWPARYPKLDMRVESSGQLAEQIGWADWVVGCETFALVIALSAKRIAISSLPPWAPPCRLPHRELVHVRKLLA